MSKDDSGKGPVRCEEGLRPPLCKRRLLHWYHIVTCKCKIITLNFSYGQCVTLVCITLVPVGKRGAGWAMAGVQVTACVVGTGPSRYPPSPVTCKPSPCLPTGAGGTLQLAWGHHGKTFPGHISTPFPTLPPTQLLMWGVELRYHGYNFRLSC